jgi:hypothetical protein
MSRSSRRLAATSRPYPTLRALLRGGNRCRSPRAPWFSGYPTRARSAWAQCWKKKT